MAYAGPVDYYLGRLAQTLERPDEARAHFTAAIEMARRIRAKPFVARAECALQAPTNRTPASRASVVIFRREGEYWVVGDAESPLRLRDSKGLRYIAALIRRPGEEVHVFDLHGGGKSGDVSDAGDAGPVLDETARRSYRERLRDLRAGHEEAARDNDLARAARIRDEIEALSATLAGAFGLRGRGRRAASMVERARQTVTKAIKAAIARVKASDGSLAQRLETTIRTGTYCAYRPDPASPVDWET
jgi:hypothetical protein